MFTEPLTKPPVKTLNCSENAWAMTIELKEVDANIRDADGSRLMTPMYVFQGEGRPGSVHSLQRSP